MTEIMSFSFNIYIHTDWLWAVGTDFILPYFVENANEQAAVYIMAYCSDDEIEINSVYKANYTI